MVASMQMLEGRRRDKHPFFLFLSRIILADAATLSPCIETLHRFYPWWRWNSFIIRKQSYSLVALQFVLKLTEMGTARCEVYIPVWVCRRTSRSTVGCRTMHAMARQAKMTLSHIWGP
ncbi:hypothetical protein P280DRAFT_38648 [Massarina eburnea CBS 473.64]|uniref:Uncharacterized protein n=1 Tax=Massarina eburnea CBS 473.64 TaxID=1395130 RepID=A0A6A6RWU9_9PLEO|nr:hypothetical protein P280DRAFT_38648 [Massarina eburnea CBS 473.64]